MYQLWFTIRKSSVAIFLIVAMLFGSFSQVAHASTGDLCLGHTAGTIEAQETHVQSDKNQDQQHDVIKTKSDTTDQDHSKGKSASHGYCAAHCCLMKASDRADYKVPLYPIREIQLVIYEGVYSSDFLFGILRPPRLAV